MRQAAQSGSAACLLSNITTATATSPGFRLVDTSIRQAYRAYLSLSLVHKHTHTHTHVLVVTQTTSLCLLFKTNVCYRRRICVVCILPRSVNEYATVTSRSYRTFRTTTVDVDDAYVERSRAYIIPLPHFPLRFSISCGGVSHNLTQTTDPTDQLVQPPN